MDEKPTEKPADGSTPFSRRVGAQEARKLEARRKGAEGVWFGFGMFGLIGWSVAVPTLAGAALGLWLDRRYPNRHSWTLALLVSGLVLGAFNAWRWVAREERAMREDVEKKDE